MNPISPAGLLAKIAAARPEQEACSFMGRSFTYSELMKMTDDCARAFAAIGVHAGHRVMIHLPTIPQAITCFYGLNMLGAVAVIPAADAGTGALADCIQAAEIRAIVTTESLYDCFSAIPGLPTMIVARPQDAMAGLKKLGYMLTEGRGVEKISEGYGLLNWEGFLQGGRALRGEHRADAQGELTAAVICGSETVSLSNSEFLRTDIDAPILHLHRTLINGSCGELEL